MFTRDSRQPRIDTLIGKTARVHGDVEYQGGLHLDGHITGDVRSDDSAEASLSISESGSVEGTVQALSATGVNAEQHPAGFKELQISLRETLRHIDELILQLPQDKRPWFQAVRSDLANSHNLLIEALFPSLGGKRSKRGDP